jgi:hypothetical protein
MTNPSESDGDTPKTTAMAARELPLLADHKELLRMRIRPAEFARLLGVSKQCVSHWIRDGKIAQPSQLDGRIDVNRAIQSVLRNTDPGRLRSRVLRQAVDDAQALRANLARAEDRAAAAEAALREAQIKTREALSDARHRDAWIASCDRSAEIFKDLIVQHADELRDTPTEAWSEMLDALETVAIDAADGNQIEAEATDALESLTTLRAIDETEGGGGCD